MGNNVGGKESLAATHDDQQPNKPSSKTEDTNNASLLATFQSAVYGNDQLLRKLKKRESAKAHTDKTNVPSSMKKESSPNPFVAIYQSIVYGNEQLLKKQRSDPRPLTAAHTVNPVPQTDQILTTLSEDGVDQNYSRRVMSLFGDAAYDTDAMSDDLEDQTDSNILPTITNQKCKASLMRYMFSRPSETLSIYLWFDYIPSPHYVGCLGQQSYLFASRNDIVVAYNRGNTDEDWLQWFMKTNKAKPSQFYWIDGMNDKSGARYTTHLLDDPQQKAISDVAKLISDRLKSDKTITRIQLKPFRQAPEYNEVMNRITARIENPQKVEITQYIATEKWSESFANKACLHRFINDLNKPSLFEQHGVFYGKDLKDGFTECRGYVCCNKEEILTAYDILTKEIGHSKVVLKDCWGVSGDDISFWSSKQEIAEKFVWREDFKFIEMEENLMVVTDDVMERLRWVGCQWYDNEVMPYCWEQIIVKGSVFDGAKLYQNQEISRRIKRITRHIMDCIGTKFMGSFDFAVQIFKDREPRIYVVDINTARYTAPMQSFMAMKKFGITDKFAIRKNMSPRDGITFKDLDEKILFNEETGVGVYFHSFHPPETLVLTILGTDEDDANRRLQDLITKYGAKNG